MSIVIICYSGYALLSTILACLLYTKISHITGGYNGSCPGIPIVISLGYITTSMEDWIYRIRMKIGSRKQIIAHRTCL